MTLKDHNMTEWLYPGNPNKYRVIPAFRDLKKVDWQQNSSPAINDIVYIYVSGDVHQIKLKCKVNKVNLPKPEIDDRNYVIELKDPENTKYTELELLEEFDDPRLDLQELRKNGLTTVRHQHALPEEAKNYIHAVTDISERSFELNNEGATTMNATGNENKSDKNIILYGPPGTGKTYNSVIYAVALCDKKDKTSIEESVEKLKSIPYDEVLDRYRRLKNDGRIAFTTFHQSYGYEEFIEGIKPNLDDNDNTLSYTIEDGIFKKFCQNAQKLKVDKNSILTKDNPKIWGLYLGGVGNTELKKECFNNDVIRLGWYKVKDENLDQADITSQGKKMITDFQSSMEIGDIVLIARDTKNIDAICVIEGEYEYDDSNKEYPRARKVRWIAKGDILINVSDILPSMKKQLPRCTLFSLNYVNLEKVFSIASDQMDFDLSVGYDNTNPYVFIIDEINRGNISKIFGELITLIEDTKRNGASEAMEATLPYSGESFSVPQNVYILGTMNTADRSIALMDTALRRRFGFIEMLPDPEVLDRLGIGIVSFDDKEELNLSEMLRVMNKRIEYLYDREHTIGHAFFIKLATEYSLKTLAEIFKKKIIPLLQEYFYDDYEKIQLVLGDNQKEDDPDDKYKFIKSKDIKINDIFNGNPDIDTSDRDVNYEIQESAFYEIQSYKKIGKGL